MMQHGFEAALNVRPDFRKKAYRWVFIGCLTFLMIQVAAHICLSFGQPSFAYQMGIEMIGVARLLAGWSGWALLIASVFYFQLKQRLFYFGVATAALTIWISWGPVFIKA